MRSTIISITMRCFKAALPTPNRQHKRKVPSKTHSQKLMTCLFRGRPFPFSPSQPNPADEDDATRESRAPRGSSRGGKHSREGHLSRAPNEDQRRRRRRVERNGIERIKRCGRCYLGRSLCNTIATMMRASLRRLRADTIFSEGASSSNST